MSGVFTVMSTEEVYSHTKQAAVGEECAPVYCLNEERKLMEDDSKSGRRRLWSSVSLCSLCDSEA